LPALPPSCSPQIWTSLPYFLASSWAVSTITRLRYS
jgi:hypothetical protein